MNPVLGGYLWVDRILVFVALPIIVLAVAGALASQRWAAIPVALAFGVLLYGLRRVAL